MRLVHSIVTIDPVQGLLDADGNEMVELFGYSVTMEGEVVPLEWPSVSSEYIGDDLTWEDLFDGDSELRAA